MQMEGGAHISYDPFSMFMEPYFHYSWFYGCLSVGFAYPGSIPLLLVAVLWFSLGEALFTTLDLGLDEVDIPADLRAGHMTQAWQGKPYLLPGQCRDGGVSQSADFQLYVEWFMNCFFYTWRTFLVASYKNLPSNILFIMHNICLFCCCFLY